MNATYSELIRNGLLTGLAVAAPLGPVNMEIMRRSLRVAPSAGFCVGLGAVVVDATYLTLFSMGFGAFLKEPTVQRALFLVGGAVLCWLGGMALLDARKLSLAPPTLPDAEAAVAPVAPPRGVLLKSFLVGLSMTFSSPFTIAFWSVMALGAVGIGLAQRVVSCAAVMAGCLSWVCTLTLLMAFARRRVGPKLFVALSLAGGICVTYIGLDFIARGVGLDALLARGATP